MSEELKSAASSTGRLAAVEEKVSENETVIAWMLATAKKLGLMNLIVLVSFIAIVAMATLRASNSYAQDTKALVDAGIADEVQARKTLQTAFEEHLKDDREDKRQQKAMLGELAADIRAAYRAQQTGQPQARLERPPQMPDGGP